MEQAQAKPVLPRALRLVREGEVDFAALLQAPEVAGEVGGFVLGMDPPEGVSPERVSPEGVSPEVGVDSEGGEAD